ncbi:zonadhesin-like isoform X3 [Pararge aegeria]|uniref:zonadhesin-like isoform X3 n=1 Tax=Pararge aegeria TaxID=116150 RepID=UPI0019CFFED7|nr:zonadhesin-like isoform X3 [Pararge aegeria]
MLKSFSLIATFICVVNLAFVSGNQRYKRCRENEVLSNCVNRVCEYRRCSELSEPLESVVIDPSLCKKGCICKDQYLKAENGTCIPVNQCPNAQCGENQVFDMCPPTCPTEECGMDPSLIFCLVPNPEPGDPRCQPACRCIDGYCKNRNDECIPQDEFYLCGENEEPTTCIEAVCERRTCSDLQEQSIKCVDPNVCTNGCLCKDGYLRNAEGECVPVDQCPDSCGANEIPTSCFEAICEPRNCSDLLKSIPCVRLDTKFCTNGCLCKEGYLRAENGTCVPIDQCPGIQCGCNEIYDSCPPLYPGENCGVDPSVMLCLPNPEPGDPFCTPGCRCKDNYFRNDNGFCVPRDQCPKTPTVICGPDEVPTDCVNGGCGIWYCAQTQEICNLMLDDDCKEGCHCKEGMLRTENGTCVAADQCPPKCDGPHEYFSCGSACDNVCATLKIQNKTNCPITNKKCNPKCYCQEGYARDSNNICIPIRKCPPPVCGINEVYDTCIAPCPPRRCDVDERVIRCPRPPQPGDPNCQSGCRCADGFYRNYENVCVPKSECPICPKNERPTSCIQARCEQRNCSDLMKPVACVRIDTKFCTKGCLCDDGYLRAKNGTCVPVNQCPEAKCGFNEVFDICPSTCPGEKCGVEPNLVLCSPNLEPGDPSCQPRCRCVDGYLRNNNGKCVPKDKCPKPPGVICGADEDYNSCENGGCGRWKCSQPGIICIDLIEGACREGCRCKKGKLRAANGTCIPADQCPLNCYGENEVAGCKSTCPQTCESIGKKYSCPLQPAVCTPECRCKQGYFRNKLNECISKDDCLKCTGPKEYFSCGGACDNVCATLAVQNQTVCPIVNIVCNKMCYCEEGYARNENNTCVPISECPPVCGINEIFDNCPATCPPQTCDALNRAYKCKAPPKPGDPECKPSCRCTDNHYRNDKGVCVPRNQCLNCNGQNEVKGCRSVSPQTCESIGKCPIKTRLSVCIPECRCKEGYFRNKINQCISREDCLKCTGPNEYFSCGGACDNVCSTLAVQNQTICPIVNIVCNKMCYCEKEYARDNNNTCVPISQCPKPVCGKNEIFDECPATCPPETCVALKRAYKCEAPPKPGDPECKPSCRCSDNHYRNEKGVCVPRNQCLNCVGRNEVKGCKSVHPQTCESMGKKYPIDQITRISVCIPECRCKEGYLRNKNYQCVSKEDCDTDTNNELKQFEQGNVAFTEKFLYEAAKANPGVSLIFSPFSVLFLLAQLALYAKGILLEQLLGILNLESKAKIRSFLPYYLDTLSEQKNVTFDLAEKIFATVKLELSDDFKRDTKVVMKAEAQNVDFGNANEAANIINKWVEEKTKHLIKNLVSPDSFDRDTVLVLVNALYFKGNWKKQFNPDNTRFQDFHVTENKKVQVNMMSRTGSYKYAEISDIDAQVIQLPYESANFSFMVWLPKKKINGLNIMLDKLKDSNYEYPLSNILSNLKSVNLDLSLPIFNSSTTTDLKDMLSKANAGALFKATNSDLTGIFKDPVPTYVSSATQKAIIIVSESGSEAAAANAVMVGVTSAQVNRRIEFIADHPFIYYILYKGTPIFCGIYFADV